MTKNRIIKKIVAGILTAIIITSTFPNQNVLVYADKDENTKVDAEVDKYEEEYIPSDSTLLELAWAYSYGIVEKLELKDFKTDISRKEMYEILIKLYEVKSSVKEATKTEKSVTPVAVSVGTELSVFQKAEKIGLLTAEEVKSFEKDGKVTRGEVAKAVYKVAKLLAPESKAKNLEPLKFADINKISVQDMVEIEYIVSNSILNGRNDKLLDLESNCSQTEFIVVAKRLYDLVSYENNEYSKGFLYDVKGAKNEVYIVGSIGLADARIYPMRKDLLEKLENSKYLVLQWMGEMNITEIFKAAEKLKYEDGTELKNHISKELYDKTVAEFAKYNIEEDEIKNKKIWSVCSELQMLELLNNEKTKGSNLAYLIEVQLGNKADELGKKKLNITDINTEVDMIESISEEVQASMLEYIIESLNTDNKTYSKQQDMMLDAWYNGDMEKVETILKSEFESFKNKEVEKNYNIYKNRKNEIIVPKIKEYLNQSDNYFIIVDLENLIGDKGVLKELEKSGITVERIK